MASSAEMTAALKRRCVPRLRSMGFKGSFPHFYRDDQGFVCLVNVQFSTSGTAFCINLGFADPARRNVVSHCRHLDPRALKLAMTGGLIEGNIYTSGRWRIGSQPLGDGLYTDSWFSFGPGQQHDCDVLAGHCAGLIEQEAEAWWAGRRAFAAALTGSCRATSSPAP